jgi:hypothetical protein
MFTIKEKLKQLKQKSELSEVGNAIYHLQRSWLFDEQQNSKGTEKQMTEEEISEWRLNRIIKERDEKKLLFTNYKSPFIKETIRMR